MLKDEPRKLSYLGGIKTMTQIITEGAPRQQGVSHASILCHAGAMCSESPPYERHMLYRMNVLEPHPNFEWDATM